MGFYSDNFRIFRTFFIIFLDILASKGGLMVQIVDIIFFNSWKTRSMSRKNKCIFVMVFLNG